MASKTRPSDELTTNLLKEKDPLVIAKVNLLVSIGARVEHMNKEDKESYHAQVNTFIKAMRKRHGKNKLRSKNQKPKPKRLYPLPR